MLNEETFYRGKSDTKRSVASNQSKNTLGVSVKRYVMKKQREFLQEENIRMASMVVPLPARRFRISAPDFEQKIDELRI